MGRLSWSPPMHRDGDRGKGSVAVHPRGVTPVRRALVTGATSVRRCRPAPGAPQHARWPGNTVDVDADDLQAAQVDDMHPVLRYGLSSTKVAAPSQRTMTTVLHRSPRTQTSVTVIFSAGITRPSRSNHRRIAAVSLRSPPRACFPTGSVTDVGPCVF